MLIYFPLDAIVGAVPEAVFRMQMGVLCSSERFSLLALRSFSGTFFLSSFKFNDLRTTSLRGFLPLEVCVGRLDVPLNRGGGGGWELAYSWLPPF